MINLTPEIAVQKLLWIIEVQAHINDCCETLPNDHECMDVASELQDRVDEEWNSLGLLIGDRPRPHSALRRRPVRRLVIAFKATLVIFSSVTEAIRNQQDEVAKPVG